MNKKSIKDRAKILQLLTEGNSVRGTARIADVSINTVLTLLKNVGTACGEYQNRVFRELPCTRIEVDEMHSFVGCRGKNVKEGSTKAEGIYWIWTSICPDTKIMPTWYVGPRDALAAKEFMLDLASRFKSRVQLTSDGFAKYRDAVEAAFGSDIDYAVLMKQYDSREHYVGAIKKKIAGEPNIALAGTSYIERSNLTLRMGCRRFARKTNAHSKKLEYHCHALSLHFAYYNFVRIHGTLRVTPAMAAGVTNELWSLEDLVRLAE